MIMMARNSTLFTFICIGLLGTTPQIMAASGIVPPEKRAEMFDALNRGVPHAANELLVQFDATATSIDKARALKLVVGQQKKTVVAKDSQNIGRIAPSGRGDLELIRLPKGLAVSAAIRSIERDPAVLFAEPNWVYQHQATSNDPYFTNDSLWGMKGGFGTNASAAWADTTKNKTNCSSVYVGIIDEGYQYTHPDLVANAGKNTGETAGNGSDDDRNGYVDDVYGWDFYYGNNSVYDGLDDDHGTHVAGTIGAVGGNGEGVAGVCWQVKLLSGKFLGPSGGYTDGAVAALNYFANLKAKGFNIVATNNSWGGGGYSQALKDAIDLNGTNGILFVAAAGNSKANIDKRLSYPAAYTSGNIIAVAAIDKNGALASFSNYGAINVDIGAPGVNIWSTVPNSTYAAYSGTSMATPHVTGAVALYAALNPKTDANQSLSQYALAIRKAILDAGIATTSLSGKTSTGDRLNVGGF